MRIDVTPLCNTSNLCAGVCMRGFMCMGSPRGVTCASTFMSGADGASISIDVVVCCLALVHVHVLEVFA